MGNLRKAPGEPKYRRVRLNNAALDDRLLRHVGGRKCLEALGFTQRSTTDAGDECLALSEMSPPSDGEHARAQELINEARAEVERAASLSAAHEIPYALALGLDHVRRVCRGDNELARDVSKLLLENDEFRAQVAPTGPLGGRAQLAPIVDLFRSAQGLRGLLEYYEGAPPPNGTRVVRVESVDEWKAALDNADDRPLVLFASAKQSIGCRVLGPIFARLPDVHERVDFVRVDVESADDGNALRVLDEAGVGVGSLPAFLFFSSCLELRKWRYVGADVGELTRRIERIAEAERPEDLDDGPEGEPSE